MGTQDLAATLASAATLDFQVPALLAFQDSLAHRATPAFLAHQATLDSQGRQGIPAFLAPQVTQDSLDTQDSLALQVTQDSPATLDFQVPALLAFQASVAIQAFLV